MSDTTPDTPPAGLDGQAMLAKLNAIPMRQWLIYQTRYGLGLGDLADPDTMTAHAAEMALILACERWRAEHGAVDFAKVEDMTLDQIGTYAFAADRDPGPGQDADKSA